MTLPIEFQFPAYNDFASKNQSDDLNKYLREQNFQLKRMYEMIVDVANGRFRGSALSQEWNWTPTLKGTTASGTFTYSNQIGWALRQGIMTDCWFDITWTAQSGATGNLYVELPYQVAKSDRMPFVGIVQHSGLTITGFSDIVVNGIPDTFRGEFWKTGGGATTTRLAVASSGRLIGFIRYIGQQYERKVTSP